jgi:hypothetical protein
MMMMVLVIRTPPPVMEMMMLTMVMTILGEVLTRECLDELVGVGRTRRLVHLLVRGPRLARPDVLHDRAREQHGLLLQRDGGTRESL